MGAKADLKDALKRSLGEEVAPAASQLRRCLLNALHRDVSDALRFFACTDRVKPHALIKNSAEGVELTVVVTEAEDHPYASLT